MWEPAAAAVARPFVRVATRTIIRWEAGRGVAILSA